MAQNFNIEGILSITDENFSNTLGNAAKAVGQLGKNTENGMKGASNSLDGVSSASERAVSSIGKISLGVVAANALSKAFGAVKDSVGDAVSRFDTLNNYPKVMEQLGYSTKDVSKSMDTLKGGIVGLPTSLDGIVSSAKRMASITGDLDSASKASIALNDAFLASGSSTADAARGLEQYVQMLSTGKVDLEAWKTLQETMPSSLKKVAEAFGFAGKSATNDLYAALQSGSITMDQLNDKFIELDGGVNGFAKQARVASGGIKTSFENMHTAIVRGLANSLTAIDDGLSKNKLPTIAETIQKAAGMIDKAFLAINKSIPVVIDKFAQFGISLQPLSGLLGGVAVGIMGLMALSKVAPGINAVVQSLKLFAGALSAAMNPMTLIVAGLALIALAFYKAYTTSEPFRSTVDNIVKALQGGFNQAIKFASDTLESFGIHVGSAKDLLKQFNDFISTPIGQLTLLGSGIGLVVGGLATMSGGFGGVLSKLNPFNSGISSLGKSITPASKGTSQLGKSILEIGVGIGAAAAGLGIFAFGVAALAKQGDKGTQALGAMTFSIIAVVAVLALLSPILQANSTGLIAVGVAALGVGTGIGLAAAGIALLVFSFVSLTKVAIMIVPTFVSIGNGFTAMMKILLQGVVSNIPLITAAFVGMGTAILTSIITLAPLLTQAFVTIGTSILTAISTLLPQIITLIQNTVIQILAALTAVIPQFILFMDTLIKALVAEIVVLTPILVEAGLTIIQSLLNGINSHIEDITTTAIEIIVKFVNTIASNMGQIVNAAVNLIVSFVNGIASNLGRVLDAAINLVSKFLMGIAQRIPEIVNAGIKLVESVIQGIGYTIGRMPGEGFKLIGMFVKGLIQGLSDSLSGGKKNGKSAKDGVKNGIAGIFSVGVDLVKGFVNGINSWVGQAAQAAANMAKGALNAAKGMLGIHSPSRVFRDEVGKYISLGMAAGIEKYSGSVISASADLANAAIPDIKNNDISNVMSAANKRIQKGLSANVNSEMTINAQPANITLNMGDQSYNAFVDNINQAGNAILQQRFGRGF
ncbi:tape measure protein [Lactobacillus terrae]|uniref:tape measure protein n=1 Tax=Lactobacillus terrae TaxID=2269374 RepID=UPI000C1B64FB|nr:tape measure protein [Lactobacillus terrae]